MHLLNLYIVVFLCFSICALVHSFYFVSDLFHLFSCQSLHLWICALLHLCINAFHHLCPFSGCSPLCSPTLAASTSHRGRACCQPAQAAPAFPPLSSISIFRTLSSLFLSYFHHYFTFSLNQYLHHRNPAPAQNVPALPFPHPSIPPSTVSIIVTSVTSRSTCICQVSIYSITISVYHSTYKECCHQFSGSYEYLGNAAASINLKKTLTFTSPYYFKRRIFLARISL